MAQVQWFVCIWGRIFHHDGFFTFGSFSKRSVIFHASEEIKVVLVCKDDIQKSLYYIVFLNLRVLLYQISTNRLPQLYRICSNLFQHRKSHESDIPFKIFPRWLKFYRIKLDLIYIFYRFFYLNRKCLLNIHYLKNL